MRLLILSILFTILIVMSGCDNSLSIEPDNNIAAISLSQDTGNEFPVLSWTPIDHPGFSRYLVIRTDAEGVVPGDSLQLGTQEIIYTTEDASEVSFTDQGPVITNREYYQVLAEINGRFIQSNTLKSEVSLYSFEGILFFGKIIGGGNSVYFVTRSPINNNPILNRYSLATKTVENTIDVSSFTNSRTQLAYGDFGTGEPEVAMTKSNGEIMFYNAQNLNLNYRTSFSFNTEALTPLPNTLLAILHEAGGKVTTFSRATNTFGPTLLLSRGPISSSAFMEQVPGKDELIIALQPTTLYRVGYDQNGIFIENQVRQLSSSEGIFTGLEMDPLGKYIMPSRFGDLFNIDDLEFTARFPGDSTIEGNRAWGFSSAGNYTYLISNVFPATMFRYRRDNFALDFSQPISPDFFIEKLIRFDNRNYFVFRTNRSPFRTLLAPLPN